ncbi:DUF262 domain-containing protein [Streptomyces cyaneofuscatus]|uniref:GmrSD restriction endonuclease domain-containing protein n=1 Tax=Streptomyces cyaneofuscatus TaxID=66883 RepID=UPI0037B3C3AA
MRPGLDTQPSATTFDLEELVDRAWSGYVRVPHFQRDFRWTRADVARLFDSIVKGYPVGSLLLWVRPASKGKIHLGQLEIDAPQSDGAFWVVDGQQRVTSLANALHPASTHDSRFSLAYDLRTSQFTSQPAQIDPWIIPLPVIFDLQGVLTWFSKYPEISSHLHEATSVTKKLRQFNIPAYLVKQDDEAILRDIFDRMNNYGKRLSRAEIFSALFAGPEEGAGERLNISLIAEHINESFGFGIIDDDTVLRAILARRGPDPAREIRSEFSDESRRGTVEFPGEDRDAAYLAGEEALRLAVQFLQNVAGVPHFTFLTYRYLLVVLCRFFAHFPEPDIRSLQLMRRWYWRTTLAGPEIFKGSFTNAMRVLCSRIRKGDLIGSVDRLLEPVGRLDQPMPDLRRFRTNEAVGKMALCALWSINPRSPRSGQPYERSQLTEVLTDRPTAADAVRYIISQRIAPPEYRLWAANRIVVPNDFESVDEILGRLAQYPLDMEEDRWRDVLASHAITPSMAQFLADGDVSQFLRARQEALTVVFRDFLQKMAEWGFENTPPLSELIIPDDEEEDTDESS